MKVYYNNIIKNATVISASTSETKYGIDYIKDGMPGTRWRSTVITSTTITFDFGVATAIKGVFVANHNIVAGDTTYKWESSADNFSSTSETGDLTLITRTYKAKNSNGVPMDATRRDAKYEAIWNRQYYRLRIQKASGSYIEIGEVYIFTGNSTFTVPYTWGYSAGIRSNILENRGPFNQLIRSWRSSGRAYDFEFKQLGDTQKDIFDEEVRENEYVIFYDSQNGEYYYGAVSLGDPKNVFTDNWEITGTFVEAR